jgi:nuclease S1
MMPSRLLLATGLAVAAGPPPAPTLFWYDLGHRIVADIAERRLTPEAARAVRDILGGQRLSDASV